MNEHLKRISSDVQQIYSRIGDDYSRQIFESRLLLTLTQTDRADHELEFLHGRRKKDRRLAELVDGIKRLDGDILIYGAGESGRYLLDSEFMKGIPVRGFIDNKEYSKGTIQDVPVYSFEDAANRFEKANIILSIQSDVSRKQIEEQIACRRQEWKVIDVGVVMRKIDKEGLLAVSKPYYQYIYDLVNTSELASEVFHKIKKAIHPVACWITFIEGDNVGKLIKEKWGYYPWCCYLTNDKTQKEYNGIPVYTYEEAVAQYKQLDIVIESEQECEIARKNICICGCWRVY